MKHLTARLLNAPRVIALLGLGAFVAFAALLGPDSAALGQSDRAARAQASIACSERGVQCLRTCPPSDTRCTSNCSAEAARCRMRADAGDINAVASFRDHLAAPSPSHGPPSAVEYSSMARGEQDHYMPNSIGVRVFFMRSRGGASTQAEADAAAMLNCEGVAGYHRGTCRIVYQCRGSLTSFHAIAHETYDSSFAIGFGCNPNPLDESSRLAAEARARAACERRRAQLTLPMSACMPGYN